MQLPVDPTTVGRVVLTAGVLGTVALTALFVHRLGGRLHDRYDAALVEAGQASVVSVAAMVAAVALVAIWEAFDLVERRLRPLVFEGEVGLFALVAGLALVVAYSLTRITRIFLEERDASIMDSHRREVLQHIVELAIFAATVLFVLALAGINPRDLLISASLVGVVFGLAARQTLGAVFAGFVLLFSRPFEVGDWVAVGDSEGIVRDISIFNTTLRTFDDEHVMIPNDEVTANEILNRSQMGRLRGSLEVGVDYDADVERAATLAEEGMAELGELMDTPAPRVVGKRFGDSAVVLELRFWIRNPSAQRLWQAKTAVIGAVRESFDGEDITIPFPQREVSTRSSDGVVEASGDVHRDGQQAGGDA
ncbi:mechanosensitive ion channel family protein [Halomarina litorea]|uniref:mechanosensitive ion channel family protein n=1 Tax=Halomarina litorea TaxID=2961595 RepID=UPI0020C27252|nr:mechanosensitive ion channel family protein [Halomarina sp. BCD28]